MDDESLAVANAYTGSDFYCDLVLSGRIRVEVVAETAEAIAFRHTRPAYAVHVVAIPRRHVASLLELGPGTDEAVALLRLVQQVAAEVEREHGAARVITNLGRYQESKHLHIHVVSGERM